MKVPNDVICGVCKKVFCCADCRYKHEIKTHAIIVRNPKENSNEQEDHDLKAATKTTDTTTIYLFCPLCERKPLPLQREMYEEMLAHVEEFHLPLRCRKCAKESFFCRQVYTRIDDVQNFSKCTHTALMPNNNCCHQTHQECCNRCEHAHCDTVTLQKELAKVTISTQTSPFRHQTQTNSTANDFHQTPMSLINLRWKAKNKLTNEELGFGSDSVSSLKNISSICSGRRSLDAVVKPKGQLVRTTSTPVHAELLHTKPTERTFNDASGGSQVSSIHHSAGEPDNSQSPAVAMAMAGSTVPIPNAICLSPNRQQLESFNRYLKVGGARAKMTAVTPLQQVMSKSIQKAFAEHGGLPTTATTGTTATKARLSIGADFKPLSRKIFESQSSIDGISPSPSRSPLDLRLSPAVRRTHQDSHHMSHPQTANAWLEQKSSTAMSQNICHEVLRSSQKITTTESIVITRTTQHRTSLESATTTNNGLSSDNLSSIASKMNDKSTSASLMSNTSNYNSMITGSSSTSRGSVYKSCQSIEIVTSTHALSDIQQDYFAAASSTDSAASANGAHTPTATADDVELEKIELVTEGNAAQVVSSNLPPITPITRIPGAIIHKKQIRFDSPCEEDEYLEEKSVVNGEKLKENVSPSLLTAKTPKMTPVHNTPLKKCAKIKNNATETPLQTSNTSVLRMRNKLVETPLSTNTSTAEAFFTPNATPIRKSSLQEKSLKMHDLKRNTMSSDSFTSRAKWLARTGRGATTFDRKPKGTLDNEIIKNDEVSHGAKPKKIVNQNTPAPLGRSWSFSAILGSMMRLPSKSKGTPPVEKANQTPSPQYSKSLIQRCASLAGSLVRSQSLLDKKGELGHQKRKRCYTADTKLLTNPHYERSYSDPISPNSEDSTRTKRLRIHGRKPIDRMRKDI